MKIARCGIEFHKDICGLNPSTITSIKGTRIGSPTHTIGRRPFSLYSWDGNAEGITRRFPDVSFDKKMRPEGITYGTIGGRGVTLFVDDRGGYQFLWNDDPRLQ